MVANGQGLDYFRLPVDDIWQCLVCFGYWTVWLLFGGYLGVIWEMFGVVWGAFGGVRRHTELPWNTPEHHWNTPKFRGDRVKPSGPLNKREPAIWRFVWSRF